MVRRRVHVAGRVQGVFFRDSCERRAHAEGVTGWVANRADGRVEAVFEGDEAAVNRMVAWCRIGPSRAVVTGVDVTDEPPQGERGFRVRDAWN
ncbi:MAG: acylphosphatase [Actinobacteria bacterium]|nr:acylphosphatase [Actinomycetota bacterium]MBV8958913.1 acylphosphatase [Actinomycetota bacterium]MBV9254426.1 acylphosphatase [Actinomycetota bacterium]